MRPPTVPGSLSLAPNRAEVPHALAWTAAALLVLTGPALAQSSGGAGDSPHRPSILAIRGADIHPVVGEDLPEGTLLIEDGKISAVSVDIPVPEGAEVYDATGLHLYPGLIDGDTTLGLIEIPTVRGTVDTKETGRVNPNVRAELAVNPGSHLIPVARAGGVTSALVVPRGELLDGMAALMNLDGWTWEEMLIRSKVGLHLRFPTINVERPWWEEKKSEEELEKEREKKLAELNRIFDDAEAYHKAVAAAREHPELDPPERDLRLEALGPVLRREMPLIVTAVDLPTIKSALEWSEKRSLRIILHGAADAWKIAEDLAKREIPILLQDTRELPERPDEPYDTPFTTPRKLYDAGVMFCFTTGSASAVRNLSHNAAMAVAFGLDRRVALKALTLYPAIILGVEERLGSIEVGKDANLILTDGDPLEIRTHVVAEWIGGRRVDLRHKQVRLYEKYRSRPRPAGRRD